MADEKTRMFDQAIDEKRAEARKTGDAIPWSDLSTADKLERLREIVKQLQHTSEWHGRRIGELASHMAAMNEHAHVDGNVVVPIRRTSAYGEGGSAQKEKKVEGWF